MDGALLDTLKSELLLHEHQQARSLPGGGTTDRTSRYRETNYQPIAWNLIARCPESPGKEAQGEVRDSLRSCMQNNPVALRQRRRGPRIEESIGRGSGVVVAPLKKIDTIVVSPWVIYRSYDGSDSEPHRR
ncbi:hypothetical protein H101_04792 [Trichophyton interdigitale H6]|nr:hypothetical protein H101_04792 [Trichophyton interdigitale H6]